jgi:signal transduction histidine kinase
MDAQMLQRLFHPFVTTKGEAGTGLGLWVSKGILDKHHAEVAVRTKPKCGTVFRIIFPTSPETIRALGETGAPS